MTDLEKCDQLQGISSSAPDQDIMTLRSYGCHSRISNATLSTSEDTTGALSRPEGGLKANITVLGSFIALLCTFGQINAFGTYQSWYSTHQLKHMSPSAVSWIGSLQLWVFFFLGGFIGSLFDAYGPSSLMACGTALYFLSAICTSFSTAYHEYLLSQGILFGVSVGLLFYPCIASISTYFTVYRATAIGIATAGASVGGVLYPIILRYLFGKVGFPWAVRICGIFSTVLCSMATLSVTCLSAQRKSTPTFNVNTFKDSKFAFLTAGSCIISLGVFIPFFYIVDYVESLMGNSNACFFVLAAMNAGGILGRVLPAYLSDTIGRFNLLIPSAFLSGLSCLVIWKLSYDLPMVFVFAITYGFFSGAFISVINPCVAQISGAHEIGARMGMLYTANSFPSLLGGPLAGVLLTRNHGSYSSVIIFSGTTLIAGSFLILFTKFAIDRRILAKV